MSYHIRSLSPAFSTVKKYRMVRIHVFLMSAPKGLACFSLSSYFP